MVTNAAFRSHNPAVAALLAALMAALAPGAANAATTNPLEGIHEARQIAGPDFPLTQGRGRVILLLYWGVNSADSKGALSTLAAVQARYAGDKRVATIGRPARRYW